LGFALSRFRIQVGENLLDDIGLLNAVILTAPPQATAVEHMPDVDKCSGTVPPKGTLCSITSRE